MESKVPDLTGIPFPRFQRMPREYLFDIEEICNDGVIVRMGEGYEKFNFEDIPQILPHIRRLHRMLDQEHTRWVLIQELRALVYD